MKILLIQPPFPEEKISSLIECSPIELIALAGYIKKENKDIDVKIYDANKLYFQKNNKIKITKRIIK